MGSSRSESKSERAIQSNEIYPKPGDLCMSRLNLDESREEDRTGKRCKAFG